MKLIPKHPDSLIFSSNERRKPDVGGTLATWKPHKSVPKITTLPSLIPVVGYQPHPAFDQMPWQPFVPGLSVAMKLFYLTPDTIFHVLLGGGANDRRGASRKAVVVHQMKHGRRTTLGAVLGAHHAHVFMGEPMLKEEVCPPVPHELSWPNQLDRLPEVEQQSHAGHSRLVLLLPRTAVLDHVNLTG